MEPVTDFPWLVRFNDDDLKDSQDHGEDVRFIAVDNKMVLHHDIEAWGEKTAIWVRIPTALKEGDGPVTIWMYYGNKSVGAPVMPKDTWTGDFVSVHHLSADLKDATGKGHDGMMGPNSPDAEEGMIADGRDFNGKDDQIILPKEPDYGFTKELYVSAWLRVNKFDQAWQPIITKGDEAWRLQRMDEEPNPCFGSTHVGFPQNLNSHSTVDDKNWHHVAIVFGGDKRSIYVDGALKGDDNKVTDIKSTNDAVAIGANTGKPERHFNGRIDEVRIANKPRSASWIALEFATVNNPELTKISAEQQVP